MIQIPQANLVAIVGNASRITNARSESETEKCLLLSAEGGTLTAKSTNYTMWISLQASCSGDMVPVAVNAARLLETISQMRSKDIELDHDGARLTIKGVGSSKRSLPAIMGDFPQPQPLPNDASFGMDAAKFREGVDFVRPFVGIGRPNIPDGLHLHSIRGAIRAVGSNRSGLGYAEVGSALTDLAVTLPLPFLDILERCLPESGPFFITVIDRAVEASWKGGSIRSPLSEGVYPDYTCVIPSQEGRGRLSVNADELVAATRCVRGLGHESKADGSAFVKLKMNGTVEMTAQSPNGEAVEPVDAEWSGEPLDVGFLSGQVISCLSKLKSAPLTAHIGGALDPILFTPDKLTDRLAVMMPVRF